MLKQHKKAFKYLNPLDKSIERVLGYGDDGNIFCLDSSHKEEINYDIKILNLNFQKLKDARKSIIKGVKKAKRFRQNQLKSKWNKEQFKKEALAKCKISPTGVYEPFIQVKIYELKKL